MLRRTVRTILSAVIALSAALPGAITAAPVARAAIESVTLEASGNPVAAGTEVTLTVRTFDQTTGEPQGSVPIEIWPYGAFRIVDAATDWTGVYSFTFSVPFGTTGLKAERHGQYYAFTPWLWLTGQGASSTSLEVATDPVVEGKPVTFLASAWSVEADHQANYGTFTIHEEGSAESLGGATVDGQPAKITLWGGLPAGTHHVVADFGGIVPEVLPSSSEPLTVVVAEDAAVSATPPVNRGTSLYPVNDGYRDTLITEGHLLEPGTVAVRVRSTATNAVVRTLSLGHFDALDTPYASEWNGRRADGTIVAAGSYRFEHLLTDDYGNTTTLVTPTFGVSLKKLAWTTVASATKQGRQYSYYSTGDGWISTGKSSYAGGVRTRNRILGYRLTLSTTSIPSRAVVRRVTFSVRGRTVSGAGWIAIHNETLGSASDPGAYDTVRRARTSYGWTNASTSAIAAHLVGRTGYGSVEAVGTFDIDDVKLTLSYAVLK